MRGSLGGISMREGGSLVIRAIRLSIVGSLWGLSSMGKDS